MYFYDFFCIRDITITYFQDEVPLPNSQTHKRGKVVVNLEECILCQRKLSSEYLSSSQAGKAQILSLANENKGNDELSQ